MVYGNSWSLLGNSFGTVDCSSHEGPCVQSVCSFYLCRDAMIPPHALYAKYHTPTLKTPYGAASPCRTPGWLPVIAHRNYLVLQIVGSPIEKCIIQSLVVRAAILSTTAIGHVAFALTFNAKTRAKIPQTALLELVENGTQVVLMFVLSELALPFVLVELMQAVLMRARTVVCLACVFLCAISASLAQKLSEEEAIEGSANLMSPDDEDSIQGSGLPPEPEHISRPATVKPQFVTKEAPVPIVPKLETESIPTVVTRRPPDVDAGATNDSLLIYIGAGVIIALLLIIILVFCCCRKSKNNTEYTQGTARNKDYV
uniref:Transmembrane protein n=1 Tax=Panagrellus redivivus TaxID=6233 RepID=A0A7E4VGQ8_PANRE